MPPIYPIDRSCIFPYLDHNIENPDFGQIIFCGTAQEKAGNDTPAPPNDPIDPLASFPNTPSK